MTIMITRTDLDAAGIGRQTLRDWVHRYNASGLDGLTNLPDQRRSLIGFEPVRRWRSTG